MTKLMLININNKKHKVLDINYNQSKYICIKIMIYVHILKLDLSNISIFR